MHFAKTLLATAVATIVGGGSAFAAEYPTPDGSFEYKDMTLSKDVVAPGYGDISTNVTINGAGHNFTISDDKNRGQGATLSVTGGTTTFQNMETFTMLADHTGY